MKSPNKRKKVLTYFPVQAKLAAVFVFWALILVIVILGLFFVTYVQSSHLADDLPTSEQYFAKMLLIEQSKSMAIMFGGVILLFLAIMGSYILIYTHRLTGPVYKMRRVLETAAESGEWPGRVTFRKKDAFQDLAKAFNAFTEKMKSR